MSQYARCTSLAAASIHHRGEFAIVDCRGGASAAMATSINSMDEIAIGILCRDRIVAATAVDVDSSGATLPLRR